MIGIPQGRAWVVDESCRQPGSLGCHSKQDFPLPPCCSDQSPDAASQLPCLANGCGHPQEDREWLEDYTLIKQWQRSHQKRAGTQTGQIHKTHKFTWGYNAFHSVKSIKQNQLDKKLPSWQEKNAAHQTPADAQRLLLSGFTSWVFPSFLLSSHLHPIIHQISMPNQRALFCISWLNDHEATAAVVLQMSYFTNEETKA